ncbi:GNAT family N-acetyltransferase [Plectonema radiosum NIES-515]|uniref:GNAT family N-acetyltransferase n=1 Tax=Plectonema radiosum NIES-515 TaxID=2986073 RepID=A0ABT3AX36_9CYAN|nr:GNAT family N-acetyltransferase [Plectonema radiosum]MCV3213688.1 GNAT family N-acetyltransferase [Plectonema radiosum NIES-515]
MNKINTKLALTTPWFFHPSDQLPVNAAANQAFKQFQIRAASPADLTNVAEIITESFHSPNGIWGWAFPLLRLGIYEDLRHRLASPAPHHVCLVAVDTTAPTDNLVGIVELGVRFGDSWTQIGKSFPYLSNLAVHPRYRRLGAASELLKACEKVALLWGFKDLYLHVLENNHQARQLYFNAGYQVHQVESYWNTFFLGRSRQIFLHKYLPHSSII